ncbi:MAG TPA: glycosyltransferase [Actinotalea sp.]|nr:glycosyltransferase [Actinotalea sp.]
MRQPLPAGVPSHQPLPGLSSRLPWKPFEEPTLRLLERQFRRSLRRADPARDLLHVWPGTPTWLVAEARARGVRTVREMINSTMAHAGSILDEAYARLGLVPAHDATPAAIADESAELALYDYFFASNPEVERSLVDLGVRPEQILPTTFGWHPERFAGAVPIDRAAGFRAVFVGRIGIRKGVPDLLAAWAAADVDGELLLVGAVDHDIADLVAMHTRTGRVRLHGYADNPGSVYPASDAFVFPTLEEGGPQVTYEAAGFGLPVITTPMGAARLVEHGRTGLVVAPGSVDDLAAAISRLAGDVAERRAMGTAAASAAPEFTYDQGRARRAGQLVAIGAGGRATT